MKQTGIITMYYKQQNIGGLLQAHALTHLLNSSNYPAEQISFNFKDSSYKTNQQTVSYTTILKGCYHYLVTQWKNLCLPFIKHKLHKQSDRAISFQQGIPHSAEIYNNTNLTKLNFKYDSFVLGSDQVWNTDLLPHTAFFGEFTTSDKKVISYAASSNVKKFPPLAEKLFIQKLQRVNAVSVREQTLKEYIEKITNKKATVVLDPTFLLSPADWLKIANPAPVPPKKYIFCYFLGNKSVWQRKAARAYADKYGYELVHLPYITQTVRPADKFLKGQGRYDVGPREFISLINGAECIFTDSFHGLAFSINFSKQFYVFTRDDKSGPESMIARITDTLDLFRLQDRHITTPNAVPTERPINYIPVQEILANRKKESMEWLLNALEH